MKTKADAEERLSRCALLRPVEVADTRDDKTGRDRRSYTFANPRGGQTVVEIDADPSEQQLRDLARHLPLEERDRAGALEVMTAEPAAAVEPTRIPLAAKVAIGVTTAAAAYEIANQLGLFN